MEHQNYNNNNGKHENYSLGPDQLHPYGGLSNRYYGENTGPLFLPHLTHPGEENKFGGHFASLDHYHTHPPSSETVALRDIARTVRGPSNNHQLDRDTSPSERNPKTTAPYEDSEEEEEEDDEPNSKKRKPRTKLT
jgi:hypothetical protein